MAQRPGGSGGLGRGGRGAALLQLINQPVRTPGDAAAGSSQQPPGAVGGAQQSAARGSGEPAPPGQVHPAAVPQLGGQAATGPSAIAQIPQGQAESAGEPMGRGAMLKKLRDSQLAQQQQQQLSASATPSEASLQGG